MCKKSEIETVIINYQQKYKLFQQIILENFQIIEISNNKNYDF